MNKFEVGDLVTMRDSTIVYEVRDVADGMVCIKSLVDGSDMRIEHESILYLFNSVMDSKEVFASTREKCLEDAKKCVCGDRDKQYRYLENNFSLIANLWTTYLHKHMYDPKCELESIDVANMMCLFKLGCITTSPNGGTYDSYVDLAGYAACGAEIISDVKGVKVK